MPLLPSCAGAAARLKQRGIGQPTDFGTRISTPSAVILSLTGVELVRRSGQSYGDLFVLIGVVVVGAVLAITVFGPGGRALGDAIEEGAEQTSASLVGRLRAFGTLDTLLIFTVYAMVARLGGCFTRQGSCVRARSRPHAIPVAAD